LCLISEAKNGDTGSLEHVVDDLALPVPLRRGLRNNHNSRPGSYFQRKCTKARPKFVRVLLHPVVERLDLLAVEEAQHTFLQRAGAFARMISTSGAFLPTGLVDDRLQGVVDLRASVVDLMQVELQLHTRHSSPRGRDQPEKPPDNKETTPNNGECLRWSASFLRDMTSALLGLPENLVDLSRKYL
jgi:hypothetical protein